MKLLDVIKTIWRKILAEEEEKMSFFHNDNELAKSKHFHRLYRDFKRKGEMLFYDNQKKLLYLKTKDSIFIITDSYYAVTLEVFIMKAYNLPPYISNHEFVVFDLGMNRAYTSLFFANMNNCKHVFGFEIDEKTYKFAQENINLNTDLSKKISAFNFGLWNKDDELEIGSDFIDGHSSVKNVEQTNTMKTFSKAKVKKASKEFSRIFNEIDSKFLKVLKIDVEGSEYIIFEDLYKNNILQQFDLIIGEYHNGKEGLKPYLSDFTCLYENELNSKLGTFTYINNKCMMNLLNF